MADLAVGLASVGLGIYLAVGSFTIQLGSGYDRIGPRFFPQLVAAGLILSGGWLALAAWRRRSTGHDEGAGSRTESPQPERSAERSGVAEREAVPPSAASLSSGGLARPKVGRVADKAGPRGPERISQLGWLGLGLLLSLVLFEIAGFVLSSSVLFWMVARSFESERPVRDAGVALVLSTLVYFTFTRGLGLVLPPGIFGWLS